MMINRMRLLGLEKRSLGVSFTSPPRSETNHCELLLFHVDDFFYFIFHKAVFIAFCAAAFSYHSSDSNKTELDTESNSHNFQSNGTLKRWWHIAADKAIFTRPDNRLRFAAVALAIFPWGAISDCFAFAIQSAGRLCYQLFLELEASVMSGSSFVRFVCVILCGEQLAVFSECSCDVIKQF